MEAYVLADEKSSLGLADFNDIMSEIKLKDIKFGILENELKLKLKNGNVTNKIKLAQGLALQGEKARLIYLVDFKDMVMDGDSAIKRVDFKKIQKHVEVSKDQDLIAKLPATITKAGRNIYNEDVLFHGDEIKFNGGKNTYITDDGLTLRAKKNGFLSMVDNKITVDDTFHIKGNVDFSTGNISYQGSVVVEGDVRSGFKIFASDDIFIKGNVDAADVFSKNGSIIVESGILGKNKAKLLAGKKIVCEFVQDASLGAKEDITIKRYAFNSNLSAGGSIYATEGEGLIRGGSAVADHGIEVNTAGSMQNKITDLRISDSDYYDVDSEKLEKKRSRTDIEAELLTAKKRSEFLDLLFKRLGKLSPDKQKELDNTKSKIIMLEARLQTEIDDDKKDKDIENTNVNEKYIVVNNKCHRGVNLQIGEAVHKVDTPLIGLKVTLLDDKLKLKSIEKGEV